MHCYLQIIFVLLFHLTGISQPVVFELRSDLLKPVTGFVNYSDCIVDMNGDFLDDVVRVGGKGLFIDYQQHNGTFIQKQFNFIVQSLPTWSICAGDIDNNGYNDLLFAHSSSVSFVKANENGTDYFEELMPGVVESQRSTMADINNDGWLDAFVCHEPGQSAPFRNNGYGSMIYDLSLIATSQRPGNYAAIWTDYDNDADVDLYLTKCWGGAPPGDSNRTNLLYSNNGDGSFSEMAAVAGIDDNAQSWSTVFEDFDNDGDMDAFIVNHDMENRLYRNNGDGTFSNVIHTSGIDPLDLGAFENSSGDFNNDGFMDIFSELNHRLYLGNGDLTFTGQKAPVSPGAIGDLNDDGFLDVFHNNQVWINQGNDHHWIKINTLGMESNRNGIGARIELYGPWGLQIREVRSGQSFSPMNSLTTHFGLGHHTSVDSLIIKWPSGIITRLKEPSIDTTYNLPEVHCILPSVSLGDNSIVEICASESIQLSGPEGFVEYLWSNGGTERLMQAKEEGAFFLIAIDSNGCASVSDIVRVKIIEDVPPVIFSSHGRTFCDNETVTLIASEGENHLWSTGEISNSIDIRSGGLYWVSVDARCSDGKIYSEPIEFISLSAAPPEISEIHLLPGDSMRLVADAMNVYWYDENENILAMGPSLNLPVNDTSLLLYLEAHYAYPGEMQSGGKADTSGGGGLPAQNGSLLFESWEPFMLNSVEVYIPQGGPQGIRFVQLHAEGQVVASKQFEMHAGLNVLELDFEIGVGAYVLTTPQGNLYRNHGGLDYPYPIGDAGQITGTTHGNEFYYYFFNWQITRKDMECISERTPFQLVFSSTGENGQQQIKCFPNPVNNYLTIEAAESPAAFHIAMFNSAGVEVLSIQGDQSTESFDISFLPAGMYFLKVTSGKLQKIFKIAVQ